MWGLVTGAALIVSVDRDTLLAEAGLDWQASNAISLHCYSGQIESRAQDPRSHEEWQILVG